MGWLEILGAKSGRHNLRRAGLSSIGRLMSAEATPSAIDSIHTHVYEPVAS